MDAIERATLGMGMSLVLTPLVGLLLARALTAGKRSQFVLQIFKGTLKNFVSISALFRGEQFENPKIK